MTQAPELMRQTIRLCICAVDTLAMNEAIMLMVKLRDTDYKALRIDASVKYTERSQQYEFIFVSDTGIGAEVIRDMIDARPLHPYIKGGIPMPEDIKLPWIVEGEKLLGAHEATPQGSAVVDQLWRDFKMSGLVGTATSTPWCSAYVGGTLTRAGINTKSVNDTSKDSSQYWLGVGKGLTKPAVGCIVIFKWKRGGGHVGYVVGETKEGRLLVLGGNQGDQVKVSAFPTDEIVGFRWPETTHQPNFVLPIGTAANITTTR